MLTALQTVGSSIATKTHVYTDGWETIPFQAGHVFEYATRPVSNLTDLSKAIQQLEKHPRWFVVRGQIKDPSLSRVHRTYHGDDAFFTPVDQQWLCVDIDGMPVEGHREAIAALPDYFHETGYHYQYSSSHGVKSSEGIRLHLWFWLDRPVCDFSLREWSKEIPFVDPALYNPVQPHYTATPIFKGAPDPIIDRSGLVPGPPLCLPPEVLNLSSWTIKRDADLEAARKARAASAWRASHNPDAGNARERYCLAALSRACSEILAQGAGDRHRTIVQQSAAIGNLLGYLDENIARQELEGAALQVLAGENRDWDALRAVDYGLDMGRQTPRDLSYVGDDPRIGWWDDFEGFGEDHLPGYDEQERKWFMNRLATVICPDQVTADRAIKHGFRAKIEGSDIVVLFDEESEHIDEIIDHASDLFGEIKAGLISAKDGHQSRNRP